MEEIIVDNCIQEIQQKGYCILKNAINHDLADRIIAHFDEWKNNKDNCFKCYHFNRITNFHMLNDDTKQLVTNEYVNQILCKLFNCQQSIYSSLFFREGTAQHFHRDTPHFYTNPINNYYGVWYALENIDEQAGPLKYYENSHLLETINGHEVCNSLFPNKSILTNDENLKCLLHYNRILEQKCEQLNLERIDEQNYKNKINKGDIIIWHPNLLHGGSDIINKQLTRYSLVTHNVPFNMPVFNASHFFRKEPSTEYINNVCNYSYIFHNNIPIVNHKISPKVQKSYL